MTIYNDSDSIMAPARRAFAVTPHATNPLPEVTTSLYVGTGGDLVCTLAGDPSTEVTFPDVVAGSILPIQAHSIRDTSTTAGMVGMVGKE